MPQHRTFYDALGITKADPSFTPYEPSDPSCVRCGTKVQGKGFWWCRGEGWACHACQRESDWTPDDADAKVDRMLANHQKEKTVE